MKKRVSNDSLQKLSGVVRRADSDIDITGSNSSINSIQNTLNKNKITESLLLSMLPKDELLKLTLRLNQHIANTYETPNETINRQNNILQIPTSIFSTKLGPLEALTKYLKENLNMTNHAIAVMLERDERGIWITYRNANKKLSQPYNIPTEDLLVPLHIFNEQLSILESLTHHLKTKNFKNTEIAKILNKSPSTISTVYLRAKNKLREEDNHE